MPSAPGTNTPLAKRTMHYHSVTLPCYGCLATVKYDQRQEHTVRTRHTFENLLHPNLYVLQHNESLEVSFELCSEHLSVSGTMTTCSSCGRCKRTVLISVIQDHLTPHKMPSQTDRVTKQHAPGGNQYCFAYFYSAA